MGDFNLPPLEFESDPMVRADLADSIDWGIAAAGVPDHWSETQGEGVRVGVIDTGSAVHPDLPSPLFEHNFSRARSVRDRNGHATHVAGIIGARANDRQIVGVAPRCGLGYMKGLDDRGSGSGAELAAAVRRGVDEGCDILNCSWGGGRDEQIVDAIEYANNSGVLVIVAAGNSGGRISSPGDLEETITVGSYNEAGEVSRFSSRGPALDLIAPGEGITSTWVGGGLRRISGTSMATPFVAGIAALYKAANRGVALTAELVRQQLSELTIDHGTPGKDPASGWGLLDLEKVLGSSPPPVAVPPITYGEFELEIDELGRLVVNSN